MKYLLIFLLILLLGGTVYMGLKKECRKSYTAGFWTGAEPGYKHIGFRRSTALEFKKTGYHFQWVGIGNEPYNDPFTEKLTHRGKKFWWAE